MLGLIHQNVAQLAAAAVVVAAIVTLRLRAVRAPVSGRWFLQAIAILIAAGAVGAAYHSVSDDGLISRYENVRAIRLPSSPQIRMPRADLSEVRRAAADGSATLIDARGAGEFEAGRIADAVNLPLTLTADQRRERLASIPKNRPLIVYCSRESCETADVLGAWLVKEGFTDVHVFVGGWEAWVAATRPAR